MDSDPRLRRWYLEFNKKFFNGELPLEVAIQWAPLGPNLGLTVGMYGEDGLLIGQVIQLDTSLQGMPKVAKLTLIHEMIHVKLWKKRANDHGRKFDEELQRLLAFHSVRKLI